jgi:hypothetical protein
MLIFRTASCPDFMSCGGRDTIGEDGGSDLDPYPDEE